MTKIYTVMAYSYDNSDIPYSTTVVASFTDGDIAARYAMSLTLKSQAKHEDGAYTHYKAIENVLDCNLVVDLLS